MLCSRVWRSFDSCTFAPTAACAPPSTPPPRASSRPQDRLPSLTTLALARTRSPGGAENSRRRAGRSRVKRRRSRVRASAPSSRAPIALRARGGARARRMRSSTISPRARSELASPRTRREPSAKSGAARRGRGFRKAGSTVARTRRGAPLGARSEELREAVPEAVKW